MKLGRIYVEDVINMDIYDEIKNYNKDILIVHGTKDKIVDIKYIEKAYDTYKENNSNVKLYLIENVNKCFLKKR